MGIILIVQKRRESELWRLGRELNELGAEGAIVPQRYGCASTRRSNRI